MRLAALTTGTAGYLFTNRVHIFVMPAFLTLFWNMAAKLPLPIDYYVMIICTTAGGYIYNMYTDIVEDDVNYEARYRLFWNNNWQVKFTIYACFLTGFLLSLRAGWGFVLYGILVHFFGSLYSRPLRLRRSARPFRIKEIPFLKNVYASLFWSVALILTPYLYIGERPTAIVAPAIAISFGLSYFVELLWDLRDMRGDSRAEVLTLPLLIGESASCWILRAVHVTTCALALYCVKRGLFPPGYLAAAVHLPLGLLFLEWYRRLPEKELASHLYIIYAGNIMLISIVWEWMHA